MGLWTFGTAEDSPFHEFGNYQVARILVKLNKADKQQIYKKKNNKIRLYSTLDSLSKVPRELSIIENIPN